MCGTAGEISFTSYPFWRYSTAADAVFICKLLKNKSSFLRRLRKMAHHTAKEVTCDASRRPDRILSRRFFSEFFLFILIFIPFFFSPIFLFFLFFSFSSFFSPVKGIGGVMRVSCRKSTYEKWNNEGMRI